MPEQKGQTEQTAGHGGLVSCKIYGYIYMYVYIYREREINIETSVYIHKTVEHN